MTETYARCPISLNAGTLEFLAYSSNHLVGRCHAAMMKTSAPGLGDH